MSEFKLIAATGCPTGIAHTFMAQEALEQAAKEKGVSIKVETHGQVGVENELTPAEIAGAKAVIIAADKDVQAERFAGKRVIEVSVADGIKKADQLIADALAGKGQIKGGTKIESAELSSDTEGESFGRQVYRHLMNGVSHMLPFVVAGFVGGMMAVNGGSGFLGGIIAGFAAGYIVLGLMKLFEKLPKSLDGLKAIFLYPVFGVFLTGMVMAVVNSPMAWVNKSLMAWLGAFENANPLVLGVIVGCMCAFDMGGPVNKAAYVTGTALLAQGNTTFMAGVSAAYIAPPLITFVATTAFRKYYDENDRNAGLANLILGSTHITEGAIPFAAKDPLRMLPTFMLGSSIAAILTYMWKVKVPAPHGGFLVLPVVTHAFLWVLAIAIGAIVAGIIMGFIQKSKYEKARG